MQQINGLWLPKDILYTSLSDTEKIMLAEIFALSNGRPCTASNQQIGDYLRMSKQKVMRTIKSLEKKNYIKINRPTSVIREITPINNDSIKNDTPINNDSIKNELNSIKNDTEIVSNLIANSIKNDTQYNNNINNNINNIAEGDDENEEYWKIRNEFENKFGLIVGKGGGEKLKKLKELFDIFEHELLLEVIQGIREPQNIKSPFPYIEKIAREENAKRIEAKKKKEQADIEAKLNYVYTAEDGISLYKLDINGERQYID
jgi:DNA-binding MarR family transcriptional regulator